MPNLTFQEILDRGILQEANRLFFHPRGLSFGLYKYENTEPGDPFLYCGVEKLDDDEGQVFVDFTDEDVERGHFLEDEHQQIAARRHAMKDPKCDEAGVQELVVAAAPTTRVNPL